jgi:LysR family transcriptional regulator, nitrogen assimilation regulatory protein
LNPKQLRYFITIAGEGTFTKASLKLRIAQPALSRQISLLEEELGTPLLVRHRRGVGLTDAGAALLERARPLLVSMDRMQAEIMDYSAEPTGVLRLGCTPRLTNKLIVGPVRHILETFPKVSVRVQEGVSHQLCRAILSDELDAAIVSENLAESFLSGEPLFDEQVWLFSPADKKVRGAKVELSRIASLPMIVACAPQTTRRLLDRALGQKGLKLNVIAESGSIPMTRELILAGIGHTIAPCSALISDVENGLLSGVPIANYAIRRSLVRRNDRPTSRAFHEFKARLTVQVRQFANDVRGVSIISAPDR